MNKHEKKVIEQAIETVWQAFPHHSVINDLRTLLKQESVEPVAWMITAYDDPREVFWQKVDAEEEASDYETPKSVTKVVPLYTAPPTTQCQVPIEEVRKMVERLRDVARWGTATNEFNTEDRIEYRAADMIERLAGIKES